MYQETAKILFLRSVLTPAMTCANVSSVSVSSATLRLGGSPSPLAYPNATVGYSTCHFRST